MSWALEEAIWNHEPIITKDIFYKASWLKTQSDILITRRINKFNFTGMIFWTDDKVLSWYRRKWHVYYKNCYYWSSRVHLKEKDVFLKVWELFKPMKNMPEWIKNITRDMLQEIYNIVI